jgi:Fic family protein
MTKYIYELPDWPNFTWDKEKILTLLAQIQANRGLLLGKMQLLGLFSQDEIYLRVISNEIAKSAKIEGEDFDLREIRSSVAHRLGIQVDENVISKRNVDAMVEVTLDAIYDRDSPLTEERLCAWQAALFPTGFAGFYRIAVGRYRDDAHGPMQVVSGALGRQVVHYQAPPSRTLGNEMNRFLAWFNQEQNLDLTLKALVAHLWFVTLHPFEDGNGRLARAISELLLARVDGGPRRFYSLSSQIEKNRQQYYHLLEVTQRSNLDITDYLIWSLNCLLEAIEESEQTYRAVFRKVKFLHNIPNYTPNERQKKVVDLLFNDFRGHLTTSKYARLTKTSQDTAARDIAELTAWGVLIKIGGGRSTHYCLSLG